MTLKEAVQAECKAKHNDNPRHVFGAVVHSGEDQFQAYVSTPLVAGFTVHHMAEHKTETDAVEDMFIELQALWNHHGMTATVLEFGEWSDGNLYWND